MTRPFVYSSRNKRLLYALHCFAVAVHAVSAALGGVLASKSNPRVAAVSPLVEFVKSSTNHSGANSIFSPIPRTEFTVGALSPLVWVEVITACAHLFYILALYSPRVSAGVHHALGVTEEQSLNPARWVEYAVTATLLSAFGNLNIGISSFYYWLKSLSDGVILQSTGLLLERLSRADRAQLMVGNFVWKQATLLNITTVAALLYQVFRSKVHTNIFYYNVVPYSIWYQTFGFVAYQRFKRIGNFKDAFHTEVWYVILSLSTKVTLFWLGIASFREISVDNGWAQPTPGVSWASVRWSFAFVPFGLVLMQGFASGDLTNWYYETPEKKQRPSELFAGAPGLAPPPEDDGSLASVDLSL